jgi:hypothetical protein
MVIVCRSGSLKKGGSVARYGNILKECRRSFPLARDRTRGRASAAHREVSVQPEKWDPIAAESPATRNSPSVVALVTRSCGDIARIE